MEKKLIACPRCRKLTEYSSENSYRPFCSERCRLIDLGDWASEKFKVAVEQPSDFEEINDTDSNET